MSDQLASLNRFMSNFAEAPSGITVTVSVPRAERKVVICMQHPTIAPCVVALSAEQARAFARDLIANDSPHPEFILLSKVLEQKADQLEAMTP